MRGKEEEKGDCYLWSARSWYDLSRTVL